MTKPHILENIQIDLQWPQSAIKIKQTLKEGAKWLGEVEPLQASHDDPLMTKLLQIAADYNLAFRAQNGYVGSSYLPVRGSVPWHDDQGIGLLLNWLVAAKDLAGHKDCLDFNRCHLLTRHGQLTVSVGDISVFNGNIGHAWISNSQCMLVQTTVKALRPRGNA